MQPTAMYAAVLLVRLPHVLPKISMATDERQQPGGAQQPFQGVGGGKINLG
jgi:hypothetical protein